MVSVPRRLPALFWPRGKAETWQNGTVGMEEGISPHSHAHKEVTEDIKVITYYKCLRGDIHMQYFPPLCTYDSCITNKWRERRGKSHIKSIVTNTPRINIIRKVPSGPLLFQMTSLCGLGNAISFLKLHYCRAS